MAKPNSPEHKSGWLDIPKNVDKIWYALLALCAFTVLVDLFYHKHVEYAVEDLIPGMYGWFALASCLVLVLLAKVLRIVVRRKEDYYDEDGHD
jgi:uncharacterized membrane protein